MMNRGRPKKGHYAPLDEATQDERVLVLNIKGTKKYAAWLNEAHLQTHIPKVEIIRLAVSCWAEKNGLTQPPEH